LEPPSAAGAFHSSESLQKISEGFRQPSEKFGKLSISFRFLPKISAENQDYQRLMPKWTGLKALRKIRGAGAGAIHGHQSPFQNLPPSARNTAGHEQNDLLVGFEVEGSGQRHSPERALRTNNERKLQACQEKFDPAFSARLSGQLGGRQ
jgi:hypothetical protein